MLEIFRYYGRCNKAVNDAMLEVLERAEPGTFRHDVGGYYPSVGAILEHVYKADLNWLTDFRTARPFKSLTREGASALLDNLPDRDLLLFPSLDSFAPARKALDEVFLGFTEELSDTDLGLVLHRRNRKGELTEKILWKALIHVFNHQTHHRGMVAEVLDQLGVENDFSNLVRIE